MKRNLQCCVLAIICLLFFSACGEENDAGGIFFYDIPSNPENLDPQSAYDEQSYLIIENVFEGLLRVTDTGKLTEGIATDYSVSEDELTYIFTLRNDARWTDSNGFDAPVTAYDFVFAFERLFDAQTNAPSVADFYCIKNAKEVYSGQLPSDELGVYAQDAYTLVFELAYANAQFPILLTTAPAMPCNEEYFYETKGRYGLDARSTPSNGAFYVSKWNYDRWSTLNNVVILYRSEAYTQRREVYPYALNFTILSDTSTYMSRFRDDESDFLVTSGAQVSRLMSEGYNMSGYETTTWGLVFNQNEQLGGNAIFREALAKAVNRDEYKAYLPQGLRAAYAAVPPDVTMLDQSYRELAGEDLAIAYAPEDAVDMLSQLKDSMGVLVIEPITIIMPASVSHINYFSFIAQTWQKELDFFCKLEELDDETYAHCLATGDYTAAIVSLQGNYNNPEAVLGAFSSDAHAYQTGFADEEYDALLKDALLAHTFTESVNFYLNAEQMLLDEAVFIPLYYQAEYLIQGKGIYDAVYNPYTKAIYFANAKKLEESS